MVDAPLDARRRRPRKGNSAPMLVGTPKQSRWSVRCFSPSPIQSLKPPIGTGTTCKLVNNFISIGTSAIIAEAVATASKMDLDLSKLHEVVSAGGANSAMFQMMMPWVLSGDDSHLKGPVRIAAKDMRTYAALAQQAGMASFLAQAASQVWQLALNQGHGEKIHARSSRHTGTAQRRPPCVISSRELRSEAFGIGNCRIAEVRTDDTPSFVRGWTTSDRHAPGTGRGCK